MMAKKETKKAKPAATKKGDGRDDKMFADSVKASSKDLKAIGALVAQYEATKGEMEALMAAAKSLGDTLLDIQRAKLPAAMAVAGVSSLTDADSGAVIELDTWLSVKWPKDEANLKKVMGLLKEWKAEDLIKCEINAKFGTKDRKKALAILAQIKKTGAATYTMDEQVHSQTLKKFLGDRIAAGKKTPLEPFEGTTGTYARIEVPKVETAAAPKEADKKKGK